MGANLSKSNAVVDFGRDRLARFLALNDAIIFAATVVKQCLTCDSNQCGFENTCANMYVTTLVLTALLNKRIINSNIVEITNTASMQTCFASKLLLQRPQRDLLQIATRQHA